MSVIHVKQPTNLFISTLSKHIASNWNHVRIQEQHIDKRDWILVGAYLQYRYVSDMFYKNRENKRVYAREDRYKTYNTDTHLTFLRTLGKMLRVWVARHKHARQCSQKTTISLLIKLFHAIHKRKVGEADSQMSTPNPLPPRSPPCTVRRERGRVSMSRRMTTGLTTGSCCHSSSRLHAPPFSFDCLVFSGKVPESSVLPFPSSRLHPPSPLSHRH